METICLILACQMALGIFEASCSDSIFDKIKEWKVCYCKQLNIRNFAGKIVMTLFMIILIPYGISFIIGHFLIKFISGLNKMLKK